MTPSTLAGLYLVTGAISAIWVWRRDRSIGAALGALLLWPLWLPFALLDSDIPEQESSPDATASTLEGALAAAGEAARATPFESLLSAQAQARIGQEIADAEERLRALERTLQDPSYCPDRLAQQLAARQAQGASEAALRSGRRHLASVERLRAMRDGQAAALEELLQVLTALRSQLLVARYAGSAAGGVDGMVVDLWARVEGLGEVLAPDLPPVDEEGCAPGKSDESISNIVQWPGAALDEVV